MQPAADQQRSVPSQLRQPRALSGKLRIGFAIEDFLGHRTFLLNLRGALADDRVSPVWIPLTLDGSDLLERIERTRNHHALVLGMKARRLVREENAREPLDALFMHTQRMAHLSLGRMRKLPTFVSVDGTPTSLDAYLRSFGRKSWRRSLYWQLRRSIHRQTYCSARGVVSFSETAAKSLVDEYRVDPSNVLVLCPGVDVERWRSPPPYERSEKCRLLFIGADFERKGGDMLLRWAKETARKDFHLDIVSDRAVAPNPHVTVHRRFAPNEPGLMNLVQAANLFVLPTLADFTPWAIAEAKAAGKAIVSTTVGAIPEMVREGVDGWLVPPGDYAALAERLDHAVSHRATLAEFGERAAADARVRFNAAVNAERLIEFMCDRLG